jgi:hypothetical protein
VDVCKREMSTQKKKNLGEIRVKISKDGGPTGLSLLAEVLNWDAERLNPSKYKKGDYRHFLITENRFKDDERLQDVVREVQNEIRKDLISILKPVPVTGWRANHQHVSPRLWALSDLIVKLNGFNWKDYLAIYPGPRPVTKLTTWGLEGEQKINCGALEMGNEKLSTYEITSFRSRNRRDFLRDRLYTALKDGRIFSRLRLCEYSKCQNFFISWGRHCSEKCRVKFYNEERRESVKKNYRTRKKQRINQAKLLHAMGRSIEEILDLTGLTYKALERAKVFE